MLMKAINLLEFPRGVGSPCLKILQIPGERGKGGGEGEVTRDPLGMEIPDGWGGENQNVFHRGYGYFLEPHIVAEWAEVRLGMCKVTFSIFDGIVADNLMVINRGGVHLICCLR